MLWSTRLKKPTTNFGKSKVTRAARTADDAAAFEDTGHLAILVDDYQVGEVPRYTLWDDPLQSQTSSVVHMSIWDDGGQLVTKLHGSLQDKWKRTINQVENIFVASTCNAPLSINIFFFMLLFSGQVTKCISDIYGAHALMTSSYFLLAATDAGSCWRRRHTEVDGRRNRTEQQSRQPRRLLDQQRRKRKVCLRVSNSEK